MTKAAIQAAAVDLGSNSFRLLIAGYHDNQLTCLENRLETVQLGKGLQKNSLLEKNILSHAYEVLRGFRLLLDKYNIKYIRACGTQALRLAKNQTSFIDKAQTILSCPITVIDGEEEASLTVDGVALRTNLQGNSFFVADVGGGSTELTQGDHSKTSITVSLALGALVLTEMFRGSEKGLQGPLQKMDHYIDTKLQEGTRKFSRCSFKKIIGSGGTATAMAAIHLGLSTYDHLKVHGTIITDKQINLLFQRLASLSPEERNLLCGLEEGRGEIILAGIKIFQKLMSFLKCDQLQISDAGLLEGILLSALPDGVNLNDYNFFKE